MGHPLECIHCKGIFCAKHILPLKHDCGSVQRVRGPSTRKQLMNWDINQLIIMAQILMFALLNIKEAAKMWERAEEADRYVFEGSGGPIYLACCYLALKQPIKAIVCLRKALESGRGDQPLMLELLAEAYLKLGDKKTAARCFKEAGTNRSRLFVLSIGFWSFHLPSLIIRNSDRRICWDAETQKVKPMSSDED